MALWSFEPVASLLHEAAFDPGRWPAALDALSRSVGGAGAALFPIEPSVSPPCNTPDLDEVTDDYLKSGWATRDVRYAGAPILAAKGVVVDQDFITPEAMDRSAYYQEFLARHGRRWFAGLCVDSGAGLWVVSIQRTPAQGPFVAEETARLMRLLRPLSDAATLARSLAAARVAGFADAMELVGQPAMAFDHRGRLLALNACAEDAARLFLDPREGRLRFGDGASEARFSALLRAAAEPLAGGPAAAVVTDAQGRRHVLRAIALRGWTRFAFTGASALVLFEARRLSAGAALGALQAAFGLMPAEARLALELYRGASLREAARRNAVTYETARTYLKSVFAKTRTRRQGELVELLARCLS